MHIYDDKFSLIFMCTLPLFTMLEAFCLVLSLLNPMYAERGVSALNYILGNHKVGDCCDVIYIYISIYQAHVDESHR